MFDIKKKNEHSEFEKSIKKFREKRFSILNPGDTVASLTSIHGQEYSGTIVNVSQFGAKVVFDDNSIPLKTSDYIPSLKLSVTGTVIYFGAAIIVNENRSEDDNVEIGISIFDDGIDLNQVHAILEIESSHASIKSIKRVIELSKHIHPDFKVLVADLSTLFAELKFKLNEEEKRLKEFSSSDLHLKRLEQHSLNVTVSLYEHDIQSCFEKFGEFIDGLNGDSDAIELHKRYFRANFHAHILNAPFIHRAYHKPLNYAGDFGLMVMLYEYEDIGNNLFEKFFHRLSCNAPSAVANKNRVVFLSELILKEYSKRNSGTDQFNVTSIACGPAREVQLFLEHALNGADAEVRKIKAVCLDNEPAALEYAQRNIRKSMKPGSTVETVFLQEDAIIGLLKRSPFTKTFDNSDIISCAGLFDYVSDRMATRLIEEMFNSLAPGGILYVGNVSNASPDKFSMDFVMEWKLKFRSPDDLINLVPTNIHEIPDIECSVISEPLGLNLFLRIRKPSE